MKVGNWGVDPFDPFDPFVSFGRKYSRVSFCSRIFVVIMFLRSKYQLLRISQALTQVLGGLTKKTLNDEQDYSKIRKGPQGLPISLCEGFSSILFAKFIGSFSRNSWSVPHTPFLFFNVVQSNCSSNYAG